jgi:hypothetical protein
MSHIVMHLVLENQYDVVVIWSIAEIDEAIPF